MKINLLKEYLIKAIQNTPDDFALQDIRMHLKSAFLKLEQLEKKKNKKEPVQSNNLILNNGILMTPQTAKNTLKLIDQLINLENSKIQEFKNKKEKNENDGQFQTFFG